MKKSTSMLQCLLVALFLLAMTGCGANNLAGTADSSQKTGALKASLDLPTSKVAQLAIGNIASVEFTVTGSGANGPLPVVKKSFAASATAGQVDGIYPGKVAVAVYAKDANGKTLLEGFALNATVASGATTDVGTIAMSSPVVKAENTPCIGCHETTLDNTGQSIVALYKQSGHYTNTTVVDAFAKNGATLPGCAGCHGTSHNDKTPDASGRCAECHTSVNSNHDAGVAYVQNVNGGVKNNCGTCHQPHNPFGPIAGGSCVKCHSVGQNKFNGGVAGLVNDNNGVRAITGEFAKWSHHVTGVNLNDAHCAACHLEGTVVNGQVVVDTTKHMSDAKTHLRNADTDADMQWDPAKPNHSTMDNFCMSCHDANGATSPVSALIQKFINDNGIAAAGKTASASNPFGDTISNRYDKMQRPAVVDVDGQFTTTNASHHAVKGPKYTGRTRTAGPRQIANPAAFAANSSATLWGKRSTIYDSVNSVSTMPGGVKGVAAFNALYVPLENDGGEAAPRTGAKDLGDDSTLHCGDCHTVGQWKPGVATNEKGQLNTVAIGAHGSNNEYLLRNSAGTDARHAAVAYTSSAGVITISNRNAALLVCYNCHAFNRYGSVFNATGMVGGHVGEYANSGRCNGPGNTIPFNGYTTGKATDGTQFESRIDGYASARQAGEQTPDFGNIFGIQCANCHNSGLANGYGGIHGSKVNTYVDGMGNTNKARRFLPGLGNVMHVPGTLGGVTGGTTTGPIVNSTFTYSFTTGGTVNDTNWEQVHWLQATNSLATGAVAPRAGAGCYTLNSEGEGGSHDNPLSPTYGIKGLSVDGGATTPKAFDTWGGCDDHQGTATGGGDHGFVKKINRPVTY